MRTWGLLQILRKALWHYKKYIYYQQTKNRNHFLNFLLLFYVVPVNYGML